MPLTASNPIHYNIMIRRPRQENCIFEKYFFGIFIYEYIACFYNVIHVYIYEMHFATFRDKIIDFYINRFFPISATADLLDPVSYVWVAIHISTHASPRFE
jgi:hypothetical protein